MIKLLLTVGFIVSSLAGGLYVVHPQYERYQRQLKDNEVLEEELENIMKYVNDLKEIKRRIEENSEEFAKIRTAFPEDHDAPSLFLYLQEKIEENNLTINRDFGEFNFSSYTYPSLKEDGTFEDVEHSRIKKTVFPLYFSGRYEDVKNFFKETEEVIRIMTVEDVSIEIEGVDPFGEIHTPARHRDDEVFVDLTMRTYSY